MRLLWITLGILVIDQATKVAVRLNMPLRSSIDLIGNWFKFTFTENPGMAFGIILGSPGIVTACSIVATSLIIVYIVRVRSGYAPYTMCLAAVLGGALGNIVDRLLHGWIFDYAPLLQGRVVDFIHFHIWAGLVPDGIPLIGGQYMAFFPIFNLADTAICLGITGVLIFQKKFHSQMLQKDDEPQVEEGEEAPVILDAEEALPSQP